ncbi:TetR/AcrR family transcriptional regulator [Nocardiopsis aegyptia]|uniref:TetR/AcrR family transcriptional regulator n=1 Tax=Nocardiopsis aegyptia TaxID=220378 RepID=UPI00366E634B
MVRMSQEHMDARRRQILDAGRRCFVRNGFHATSMHDLQAETGLSMGAVYRYFSGKEAIIAAIAAEALSEVAGSFEERDGAVPPDLDEIVDLALSGGGPVMNATGESAGLLVQIWAEALRSPSLAARLREVMNGVRHLIGGLVARHQERGGLPSGVPPEHVADALIAVVDGFMVRRAVYGDADPAAFRAGLRALMAAPRPPET